MEESNEEWKVECPKCKSEELYVVLYERVTYEIELQEFHGKIVPEVGEAIDVDIEGSDYFCRGCGSFIVSKQLEDYFTNKYITKGVENSEQDYR